MNDLKLLKKAKIMKGKGMKHKIAQITSKCSKRNAKPPKRISSMAATQIRIRNWLLFIVSLVACAIGIQSSLVSGLTLGFTCCRKPQRGTSEDWRQSGASSGWAIGCRPRSHYTRRMPQGNYEHAWSRRPSLCAE